MKQRKVPLRRCTGCMEMKNKKELVRVVHSEKDTNGAPVNEFSLDFTGKKNGRGAYVCKNMQCLEKASKNKGFEHSFKCAVPKEIYESLRAEMAKYAEVNT